MSHEVLGIEAFLSRAGLGAGPAATPVFDVRTPDEFAHGSIPGAHSLPVFTNEERASLGRCYKEHGPKTAVKLGLEYVGPRMRSLVEHVEKHGSEALVHCWRGGMRSASVAWLLSFYGIRTAVLEGGYKAFRRWALGQFSKPRALRILGGMTGSGKTTLLAELRRRGHAVIDLEALALHRGSAFGGIGLGEKPTQENFENRLAWELALCDPAQPLWLEDESRHVGRCVIPLPLWAQMTQAPVYALQRPRDVRIDNILREYGSFAPVELVTAARHLERRLGGARCQEACAAIEAGDLRLAVGILLEYYDATYQWGLEHSGSGAARNVQSCREEDILGLPAAAPSHGTP